MLALLTSICFTADPENILTHATFVIAEASSSPVMWRRFPQALPAEHASDQTQQGRPRLTDALCSIGPEERGVSARILKVFLHHEEYKAIAGGHARSYLPWLEAGYLRRLLL